MEEKFAKISFHMIRRIHDGWLIHKLVDPEEILRRLGLKGGDTALEVGCGPGFYTLAASKIIGRAGRVYAFEINPYLIAYTENKLRNLGIDNVEALLQNANHTSLGDDSVDFAFVFGVPRIIGGLEELAGEIRRVLKPTGRLVWNVKKNSSDEFDCTLGELGFVHTASDGRYRTYTLPLSGKFGT